MEQVLHGDIEELTMGRGTFGLSGQLKSIVKHRILGTG